MVGNLGATFENSSQTINKKGHERDLLQWTKGEPGDQVFLFTQELAIKVECNRIPASGGWPCVS